MTIRWCYRVELRIRGTTRRPIVEATTGYAAIAKAIEILGEPEEGAAATRLHPADFHLQHRRTRK